MIQDATKSSPRRFLSMVLLAVGLLGTGSACKGALGGGGASAPAEDHPLVGAPAPDFSVPNARGGEALSLAAHQGKVVIVDFWGTWCKPCKKSFPAYEEIAKDHADKVVVLAVNVDETKDGIEAFASETGATFPIGFQGGSVAKQYQARKMPTSFVIDGAGVIRHVHEGFSAGDAALIDDEIHELTGE